MDRREFLFATTGLVGAAAALAACGTAVPGGVPTVSLSLPVGQIGSVLAEIEGGLGGALGKVSSLLPADAVTKAEALLSALGNDAKQVAAAASDPQVQAVVKAAIPVVEGVLSIFGGVATGGVLTAVIAAAPTLISLVESLAGVAKKSRLAARAVMSPAQAHEVMRRAALGQI